MVQSIQDAVTSVVMSVVSVLLGPTVLLLLLKIFVPPLGAPLWQAWCRLLGWLVVAPIRAVRFLLREAFGRRHH